MPTPMLSRTFARLAVTVLLCSALACRGTENEKTVPKEPDPPGQSTPSSQTPAVAQTILRLHGSNTIGSKLGPALVEEFLRAQGAKDIHRVPGSEENERTVLGTLPGETAPSSIEIEAHGSATAFSSLVEGRADIGMSSRPIKSDENERLRSQGFGDMTSRANEHVLALDGLAVITQASNSVDALDLDQIRDIFTCRITDWSEVNGSPGSIRLYARDNKSGTFDSFKDLVLRGQEICSSAKRIEDSGELSREVSQDISAIGFIGLPFIGTNKALKVFEGSSIPLRPTPLTVKTEDYRLSRRLFLYTAATSQNPWISRFVEFTLSDAGQKIVASTGFVDQSLPPGGISNQQEIDERPGGEIPPLYAELTRNAERVPFNFRFPKGGDSLDNKAYRDLGRLVQYMLDRKAEKSEILLFGFCDDIGRDEFNKELSRKRAKTVERELIAEGIQPSIVDGFGEALPVASNDTEEGRQKNRRVEIWLRR